MAFREPISSTTDESLALSLGQPKTAALYYDRVWDVSGANIPESVGFTAETEFEAEASLLFSVLGFVHDLATGPRDSKAAFDKWSLERVRNRTSIKSALEKCDMRVSRKLTEALSREYNLEVVPVYESAAELNREYELGEYAVIVPMLQNLQVVSEEKLRWDQVLEFRKDDEARVKFRRLAHWLDKEMVGRPQSFIEDAIEKRISDYQEAIKKHGLNTMRGSLLSLLDPRWMISAFGVAKLTDELFYGLLVGSGIVIHGVICQLQSASKAIEDVKHRNQEIAFVHELKVRLNPNGKE